MRNGILRSVSLALVLLTALFSISLGQVSGTISSDTTWTSGAPVIVAATVTVPAGVTLTIDPGTTVEFGAGASLLVAGKLVADGTPGSQILFTSNVGSPSPGDWGSIELRNSANVGSMIDNVIVEYSGGSSNAAGIFYLTGAFAVEISSSTFRVNSGHGVNTRASSPRIASSLFDQNGGYGVYSDLLSNSIIDSCTFTNNTGGGIRIPVNSTPTIQYCTIDTNTIGIFIDNNAVPTIRYNNIRQNSTGIQFSGLGSSQPTITSNTFEGNTLWGFRNTSTGTVKAEGNYWGSDLGPTHPTLNPTGTGDKVSDYVDFQPWSITASAKPVVQWTTNISTPVAWTADSVYWVKNSITVQSGGSLTIAPGTIVKFAASVRLTANPGTITADGKPDSLIVFTSDKDDPYGGDTDGGGASPAAAPGNWDMIYVVTGGNLFDNCLFRFGGSSGNGQLRVNHTSNTFSNIYYNQGSGFGMYVYISTPSLTNISSTGNGDAGLYVWSSNVTITGSDFSGNSNAGIRVEGTSHISVIRSNISGNASSGINVDYGSNNATLVLLDSSTVLNNGGNGIYSWQSSGPQTISNSRIEGNGGNGIWIWNVNDLVTINADSVLNNAGEGIATSHAVISNNIIQGNRYPICLIGRVNTTYSGNTITGNQYNNAIALRMNRENLSDTLKTVFPTGITSGTYVLTENSTGIGVASGETLVIQPGVIIKIDPNIYFRVDGTLIADGTSGSPIIFTSYRDASYGGKTNLSTDTNPPAPGNWRYIRIRPGSGASASVIDNVIMKYGGTDGVGNLWIEGSGTLTAGITNIVSRKSSSMGISVTNIIVTFDNATIDSNATYGMYIEGSSPRSDVTIRNSTIQDNASIGLYAVNNSTYREISNCVIRRNGSHGVAVGNGTIPQVIVGNVVTNNNGHGMYVISPSMSFADLQFIGNTVEDNLYDGIFSTAARFVDNHINRNRYPLGVWGRLGNIYVDNNGVDGNTFADNTYNNAIALAGSNYAPLSDSLKNIFPQAITSKTYVVIENIQVNNGTTLVIQPGVNIKFQLNAPNYNDYKLFHVYGTLLSEGTPADPIIFTSWRDSTAGGKTTALTDYGAPSPGDYYYVSFRSGSGSSVVRHTQFKYGGRDGERTVWLETGLGGMVFSNNLVRKSMNAGIVVSSTAVTIDSTTVDSCNTYGIRVYDNASNNVTLRNATITDNGSYGFWAQGNAKVSVVSNCIVSRNGSTGLYIENNSVPLSLVGNTMNQNNGHGLYVLAINDAVDSLLTIAGNKIRNNNLVGIYSSRAIVVDDSITGNRAAIGIVGQASLDVSTQTNGNVYIGNYIAGNQFNDILYVEESTYGRVGYSYPSGYASNVIAVRGGLFVPSGTTLTIAPGTIFKFKKEYTGGAGGTYRFRSDGVLKCEGTLNSKIVFTAWEDDTYGGDSNADSNATVPGAASWDMVYLNGAANNASRIAHTIIRFGGYTGNGNLQLNSNSAPIDSSFISYSSNYGIYLNNSSPTVSSNEIHNNLYGIWAAGSSNPVIGGNNIHDNSTYGLYNGTSNTINAINNYWGDSSGPFVNQGTDQNLAGTGNRIYIAAGAVNYRPFLLTRSGILLGDVSENGAITAYDGALVLRHTVLLDTLVGSKALAADVTGDGSISALDASYILRYVVGLISGFPGLGKRSVDKNIASSYELAVRPGSSPDEIELVLHLKGTSTIYASEVHLTFDDRVLTPISVNKTPLSDKLESSFNFGPKRVDVAFAATTPVSEEGDFVKIAFKVLDPESHLPDYSIQYEKFMLNEIDLTPGREVTTDVAAIPATFGIAQNYPNPFNPSTRIEYQLPEPSIVRITVYDLLGQEIQILVDQEMGAGYHTAIWNGRNASGMTVSGGVYLYRILAHSTGTKDFTVVKKMVLLK